MNKRLIVILVLIAYSAILIKVMVLKDVPLIRIGPLMLNFGGTQEGPSNFIPFKTILPYLLGEKGLIIAALNIGGNIALFVPVGLLFPFVFRNIRSKKMLAIAVASGLIIEGMQVVLRVGIFDIDDVLLNGLGVMLGYWTYIILAKMNRSTRVAIIIITSVIVVAAAIIFYSFTMSHKRRNPVTVSDKVDNNQPGSIVKQRTSETPDAEDPCNGTGGTGEIVSLGSNSITLKRNDGVNEVINLTDKTIIKNSVNSLSASDLKTGARVTVVVMSNHTATAVLVCNGKVRGSGK